MPLSERASENRAKINNRRRKLRRKAKPIRVPVPGLSPQRSQSKPPPKRPKAAPYSMLDKLGKKTTRPAHATPKRVKRAERQTKKFRRAYKRVEGVRKTAGGYKLDPDAVSYIRRAKPTPSYRKADQRALTAGLKILEQTARPIHGIAAGTKAGIEGKDVLSAAGRGVTLKDKTLFSDVLKAAGVRGKGVGPAGFVLDVALDPTTYLSGGLASPARKIAQKEGDRVAKKAAAKGMSKAGQATVRRAAEKRVLANDPGVRGITVGTRKHRTSGRTTATVARKTGMSKAGRKARERPVVQAGGEAVSPAFAPKGVGRKAQQAVHTAEAESRAKVDLAQRKIGARSRAYSKKLSPADQRKVIDAIEAGTVGRLAKESTELHTAAVRLRSDLRHMARKERQAGVLAKTRGDYVPHVRRQDVEDLPTSLGLSVRKTGKPGFSRERKLPGSLAEWRDKDPSLFTEDVPTIYGTRAAAGARALANANVIKAVADQGRKLTPKATWDTSTEAVYKVEPRRLVKLEGDSKIKTKEIAEAAEGKASGRHVILPKKLADDVVGRQTPPKIADWRAGYRRVHGKYKTLLTQPMPSYHMRNLMGDLSNASYKQSAPQLAANVARSGRALRVRSKMKKAEGTLTKTGKAEGVSDATIKIRGERVPVEQLVREAEEVGGIGQGFSRELTEMVEKPEGKLRNLGQSRENLVRLATYIGARKEGLSAREAGKRVREVHFDYQDLTDTERAVRDFLPFYTFARKNTPLQAKTLISHPGKLARYQKLIEEGGKSAGLPEDWQYNLKDYQQLGQAIPLFGALAGDKKAVGLPNLPTTDLNRLTPNPKEQVRQLIAMVSGFKAVGELLISDEGYSTFFKGPIDTGRKVAAPDWAHLIVNKIPSKKMRDAFGLEYAYDRALGKKVWKWNAKADYALKQLPETSFLFGITSEGKNRRDQDKGQKLLKLTGVSVEPFDPDSVKKDRLYKQMTKVSNRVKQLNDQGVYADKPNAEYKRLAAEKKKIQAQIDRVTLQQKARGEPVKVPKRLTSGESSGSWVDSYGGGGKTLKKKKSSSWVDSY